MHSDIQEERPGSCPKCGMTLEPKTLTAGTEHEESAELRDMTRRFWIGSALTLPLFVLAMAHLVPLLGSASWVDGDVSRWMQFALATPVVGWAGWPFFCRGWRSVVTRQLNMFTLITVGVGAAFVFSIAVLLLPQLFAHTRQHGGKVGLYFEAAAVIIVLVLLGQILELRARSRTGSAIRTLLNLAPPNLIFAFVYNALGIPVAAGALYPIFGWLLSPVSAAAAMSLSSVSVIGNALRLRNLKL
jgi:Cu+-exporting ATPase